MVELREFIACTVEASQGIVTLDCQVLSLVGAHVCMFIGEVAGLATDPAAFVFRGFSAVLCIVV